MEIIIEVVELGRRAPSIRKFDLPEILIGRAWDNDLIIADAEVDAHHSILTFDKETETFLLEDLGSANGVRHNKRRIEGNQQIDFGDTLTIGQTSFRIHRQSDGVAPARIHSATEQFMQKIGHPGVAICAAVTAIFLTQYNAYIAQGTTVDWNAQLQGLITTATGLLLWALLWGGITKLFKHQFRFWPHLGLAAGIAIASLILGEIEGVVSFNTLSLSISELQSAINISLMIFIWVSLALIITANTRAKTRTVIASVLVSLFLLTSFLLPRIQTQSWVGLVPLETKSLPPIFRVAPAKSQQSFIELIKENVDESEQRGAEAREEQAESLSLFP